MRREIKCMKIKKLLNLKKKEVNARGEDEYNYKNIKDICFIQFFNIYFKIFFIIFQSKDEYFIKIDIIKDEKISYSSTNK